LGDENDNGVIEWARRRNMAKTIPTEQLIDTWRAGGRASHRLEALDALAQRVWRTKQVRDDPAVREVLIQGLASEDANHRYHAAFGLRFIDHPTVADAVLVALGKTQGNSLDTNLFLLERAAKIVEPRALDVLRQLMANLPKGMAKAPVRDAIAKLEARQSL
jgi:hypothetical protein